ncbi:MAG: hypothetical protein RDU01_06995, partial [Thermodesulfovibrionales bacterium]|nr:hypothetical protein [Thermodesulfovibrionales bacterium]
TRGHSPVLPAGISGRLHAEPGVRQDVRPVRVAASRDQTINRVRGKRSSRVAGRLVSSEKTLKYFRTEVGQDGKEEDSDHRLQEH